MLNDSEGGWGSCCKRSGRATLHDRRAAHVEALGESFVTHFEAEILRSRLIALGFSEMEDLGPLQISARYFPNRRRLPS
jgi:hypothetical protein